VWVPASGGGKGERLVSGEDAMLRWAVIFLVVALVAGLFGLWGLEGTAMWIARVLFLVFLVLFVISLLMGRGRTLP
jgi:uncharacterized membrane protein YtjA (UPF0391 family)